MKFYLYHDDDMWSRNFPIFAQNYKFNNKNDQRISGILYVKDVFLMKVSLVETHLPKEFGMLIIKSRQKDIYEFMLENMINYKYALKINLRIISSG